MIFYAPDTHNPYFNLALEDYLLLETKEDVCMLWQNDPVVVIGRNQNVYAEVDLEYTNAHDIVVARRASGGGAVYHDLGNINYTFITKRSKENTLNFAYFSKPIVHALALLGIHATLSGRNDLIACGSKFSGTAQRTTQDRILHHGTLLFDSDLSILSKVLTPSPLKLKSKAIQSVRTRVVNLNTLLPTENKMTTQEFKAFLKRNFLQSLHAEEKEIPKDKVLQSEHFLTHNSFDFNFGKKQTFSLQKEAYGEYGYIQIGLDVQAGIISTLSISGDFFSILPIEEFSARFVSLPFSRDAILTMLADSDIHAYIRGMTSDTLLKILFHS